MAGHTVEAMRRMTELAARQTGGRIGADILFGSPIERLVEVGEDAFAIVLGKSGHGALAQAILGSTGRGVATHTHVPVIFVP